MNRAKPDVVRRLLHRRGFTTMECVVGLGLLMVAMMILAQMTSLLCMDRVRNGERQEALETAANVLETARACPWEELTADWASRQKLPESLARQPEAKLNVTVDTDKKRPEIKHVKVEVRVGSSLAPVGLEGWFAKRAGTAGGGKP